MDTVPVHYTEDLYEVDDLSLHFKPEDWLVLPGAWCLVAERERVTQKVGPGFTRSHESSLQPSACCLQGFCFASSLTISLQAITVFPHATL